MSTATHPTESTRIRRPRTETDWLTRPQAAKILGVSPPVVSRLLVEGVLGYSRLPGGLPRIRQEEVLALAAKARHDPISQ